MARIGNAKTFDGLFKIERGLEFYSALVFFQKRPCEVVVFNQTEGDVGTVAEVATIYEIEESKKKKEAYLLISASQEREKECKQIDNLIEIQFNKLDALLDKYTDDLLTQSDYERGKKRCEVIIYSLRSQRQELELDKKHLLKSSIK